MSEESSGPPLPGELPQTPQLGWTTEQIEYLVHDLKSPLASIITNLQLLERQPDESAAKRLLTEARQAAGRLERMVHNLLDVGSLAAGHLTVQPIGVVLEDLVDEAVESLRPQAAARDIELRLELGPHAADVVRVDFELMTRVLVNLLENAVRHSPLGTPVAVTAHRDADGVLQLGVEDEGPGVDASWRHRIFDRFVQRGPGGPGRVGQGLGLAFAKLVAEAHGFSIGVEPRQPRGSRFYLVMRGAAGG